jgi:hypothetical protein
VIRCLYTLVTLVGAAEVCHQSDTGISVFESLLLLFVMATNCSWNTCPLSDSYWGYRPSLAANLTFLILFAISTLAYLGQGFLNKAWLGFTIAMVCGCLLEVIGYIGRVLAYNYGFTEVGWRGPQLKILS